MIRRPPRSTRTDTLFPYTTLFRSDWQNLGSSLYDGAAASVFLQPLARIDDPAERNWASEWLAAILAAERVTVEPQVKQYIWSALGSLARAPVSERTLPRLAVRPQHPQLHQALGPYFVGAPFRQLPDAHFEQHEHAHS